MLHSIGYSPICRSTSAIHVIAIHPRCRFIANAGKPTLIAALVEDVFEIEGMDMPWKVPMLHFFNTDFRSREKNMETSSRVY